MWRNWLTADKAVKEQRKARLVFLLSKDVFNTTILEDFIEKVWASIRINRNWVLFDHTTVLGSNLSDVRGQGYWNEILEILGYDIQSSDEGWVVSWGNKPNVNADCHWCKHKVFVGSIVDGEVSLSCGKGVYSNICWALKARVICNHFSPIKSVPEDKG